MKKLMLGFTMLFSLVLLVACAGEGPTPTSTPDPAPSTGEDTNGEVGEVTPSVNNADFTGDFLIWIHEDPYAEALIPALEAEFPNVNFGWQQMGHVEQLTNLSLDGPAGIGADIILFPHDQITRAVGESLLLPLGPDLGGLVESRFQDSATRSIVSDGNIFGFPINAEVVALFYNVDLLNEHGFEVATTFEQIMEQGREFNDNANNRHILRWAPGDAYQSHFALTSHGFELFGPDHLNGDAVNLETPEVVAGLQWMLDFRNEFLPVPYADLDWDNTHGAFVDGLVPYIIMGPWGINGVLEDGDFDWGVSMLPTIGGVRPTVFNGNVIAGISSFTSQAPLARAVLEFMSSDAGIQIAYDSMGWIPALNDASGIVGLAENPFHLGHIAQAAYSHAMPVIPEMNQFWGAAEALYRSVWDLVLTPEEAAAYAYELFQNARALADQ